MNKTKKIDKKSAPKKSRRTKICPEFKIVSGTNIVVDGFCYKPFDTPMVFFLSHFHSDHYGGLIKSFKEGPIYCSEVTAELVKTRFEIPEEFLKPLSLNIKHKISINSTKTKLNKKNYQIKFGENDIKLQKQNEKKINYANVTLLDANHCPGSVMFLIEIEGQKPILHTGDFRFEEKMKQNSIFKSLKSNVSFLYLDTTYASPKYEFIPQKECCEYVANVIFKEINKSKNYKTLFVIGTYTLGKEKILLEVYKKTKKSIYVNEKRFETINKLKLDCEIEKAFTTKMELSDIHVIPLQEINYSRLRALRQSLKGKYDNIIAFKPTGWTMSNRVRKSGVNTIHDVPYSEHSSFTELKECCQFLAPDKIIPTVNNESKNKTAKMIKSLN